MKMPKKIAKYPYFPVIINFGVGLLLSSIASGVVWNWEQRNTKIEFEREIDNTSHAIQYNLDNYALATKLLGGLYEISEKLKQEEFQRFTSKIKPAHPALITVGWSPQIKQSDRVAYEQKMALENSATFEIKEHDEKGALLITARETAEYYPITNIESNNSTIRRLIGYDLASEKQHKQAIERAKNEEEIVFVRHFFLGHESTDNFVMYQPVYEPRAEFSRLNKKTEFFKGVVYVVFQPSIMVDKAIEGMRLESIDFYLYNAPIEQVKSSLLQESDRDDSDFVLFYDHNTKKVTQNSQEAQFLLSQREASGHNYCPGDPSWSACLRPLYIGQEEWSLIFFPKEEFYRNTENDSLMTLLVGMFATGSLSFYLWSSIKRNIQTDRLVLSLTQEVKQIKEN